MKHSLIYKTLGTLPFLFTLIPLSAQNYDLLYLERSESLTQTGPTTTEAPSWSSETGNFYFYAGAEISGATPQFLQVTNGTSTFNLPVTFVNTVPLAPYFYDGFDVSESSFDINIELSRQGGGDAPVTWVANSDDLIADYHQQVLGPVLQLAGDGALTNALVSPDLNFTTIWNTTNIGGKKVQAAIEVGGFQGGTEPYTHAAMTVASNATLAQAGQAGSGFSVVLIEDVFGGNGNFIQLWDGDTLIANNLPNPAGAGSAFVEIYLEDPADFNPWDGVGTTLVVVYVNGEEVGRYEKMNGGYTANYITLEGLMQANGTELATHTFDEFTVHWGTTNGSSLPVFVETEVEESYTSEGALLTAIPAGNYDFVSDAGTVETIAVGGIALPDVRPVKEYNSLQAVDPTQDITVSWDAYAQNPSADDAILQIEISYWDETLQQDVYIWEVPGSRDSELPGIDPTATSVTIPANTLVGSTGGFYNLFILYSDLMLLETENGFRGWLESVELHVPIAIQTTTENSWAGYILDDNDQADTFIGWIDATLSEHGWIFASDLNKFIFLSEGWVTSQGSWMYVPK